MPDIASMFVKTGAKTGFVNTGTKSKLVKTGLITGLIKTGAVLLQIGVLAATLLLPLGCSKTPSDESPLSIKLYQSWELQPGDTIADRKVLGGLGDISIALAGNSVYAPFDGRTQFDNRRCLIFSSPDVPAYLFRLCGLNDPRVGDVSQGEAIGSGNLLLFAALRKQPNGTWAIVEPAKAILERTLKKVS